MQTLLKPFDQRRAPRAAATWWTPVWVALLLGGASPGCVSAQAGGPAAAAEPTNAAAAEDAHTWLAALEAAAARHRTLTARVRMRSIQSLLDDETARFGDMAYAAGNNDAPACFAVRFDRLKADDTLEPIDKRYVYDGRWLLDTDATARTATRREVAAADAAADGAMGLGDGPFVVPMNLKKDRVLERFAVELAAPHADTDPKSDGGSVHLVLTPKPGFDSQATRLDLWFDRVTHLPLRAASTQDDGDETVIDLFEVALNPPLPDDTFDTALPNARGWELQTVPLRD